MQYIRIDDIKPAPYNPRIISPEKMEQLKKSISENGFCIPILVNKNNNIIIAGHQRTKAAKELGLKEVPCFFVDSISETDEIFFNQIHNGCDNEINAEAIVKRQFKAGFSVANVDDFEIINFNLEVVKQMCHLLLKYGNVLMCVIADDAVIIGKNYIHACKVLNMPVNISVIASNGELLREKYGEYSYDHLKKNTWVQGLAQKYRLPDGKRQQKSSLYERHVLPYIKEKGKNIAVLDFGCGRGEYISKLQIDNAIGVEFYNHNTRQIIVNKGQKQIDKLADFLKNGGLFDVVVCDSVLNSVDSMDAEIAILRCLNGFLKINGRLFISGRTADSIRMRYRQKTCRRAQDRYMQFLDKDGMTAIFRQGNWFYQKYHEKDQAIEAIESQGFNVMKYTVSHHTSWQVMAEKRKNVGIEDLKNAIGFEFNLPLPDGTTYNRHKEIFELLKTIYVK